MPEDPTLGEVMRRLEDVRADLKEDFRELGTRLDSKVSMERYSLEQQARDEALRQIVERVKAIESARDQEDRDRREAEQKAADRRAADRRILFSALIAPVLMLLLTLYLSAQGATA
ncbi:hypothetical protein [Streptomyces niveus]|uniref:hypothetical protein n=1 Tax=Streptomyces niveus TaxID=193462 RepID=UPI00084CC73A|nr:hypothetical protein [Streptomyces niveus]